MVKRTLCPLWVALAGRNCQMRLADAGRAEKDDILSTFDEGEIGKLMDLLARHTCREAEVKAVERLCRGQASAPGEHLGRGAYPARRKISSRKSPKEAAFVAAL